MASDNSVPLNVVGYTNAPPKHSPTFLIPVTVLAVIVTVFIVLYFLLRNLHCCLRRISPLPAAANSVDSSSSRISPAISTNTTASSAADSLPLFTFSSITRRSSGRGGGGDCAVCLSKFEQHDLLRLLPLCCHAFHAECIDTWLRSNLTCPLCRSAVFASDSDAMKFLRSPSTVGGDSFRLEIGSVSDREADGERRGERTTTTASSRSYSLGSFEYLVDEEAEITLSDARRRNFSGEKDDIAALESAPGSEPSLAGEVASGRSWLKDYVDQLSASISTTLSFRSSGRLFTGSSRRSDVVAAGEYEVGEETNRLGEEISEMFRWLSGV